MFERFTTAARTVVVQARQEADTLRHPYIGSEHLLLALLGEQAGTSHRVLRAAGLDAGRVRADLQRLPGGSGATLTEQDAQALRTIGIDLDAVLARIAASTGSAACPPPPRSRRRGLLRRVTGSSVPFTARAKKVLELSVREAVALRHGSIGTEHLLLGLLREGGGLAAQILADAGADPAALRAATLAALEQAA